MADHLSLNATTDTGQPVFLPFRMSCFVLSNLIVTAGMLTPNLSTAGILAWQITNQSLNVAINSANANKSLPLSTSQLVQSYLLAVSASCTVALGLNALVPRLNRLSPGARTVLSRLVPFAAVASAGALNVYLMRGEEMRQGIDVFPVGSASEMEEKPGSPRFQKEEEPGSSRDGRGAAKADGQNQIPESLGKSKKAATIAVSETALSRVLNSTPIMVLPALVLVRLQQQRWLQQRPRLVLPVNLGLILTTSVFALPLALGVFPQREAVRAETLEEEFRGRGGKDGLVAFNRGM